MADATRELTFFLAEPERRLLRAVAARLPSVVRSDHLTVLGVLGATGAGAAYALCSFSTEWLWAASAMLVVNWLGDSLDGTLARGPRSEPPRDGAGGGAPRVGRPRGGRPPASSGAPARRRATACHIARVSARCWLCAAPGDNLYEIP